MPATTPATAFDTLMAHRKDRVAEIAARPPSTHPQIDCSQWPVVVGTVGDGDDIMALVDAVTALHLRGPFAFVIDMRRLTRIDATNRHLIAAARSADFARFPGVRRATAWVITNDAQRRSLLPLAWLSSVTYPEEQFTRLDDATVWAGIVMRVQ